VVGTSSTSLSLNSFLGSKTSSTSLVSKFRLDGLHPSIGLTSFNEAKFGGGLLLSSDGTQVNSQRFDLGGIPICNYAIKVIREQSGKQLVVGTMPRISQAFAVNELDWPDIARASEVAIQELAEAKQLDLNAGTITKAERCYFNLLTGLEPAWDFVASFGPYQYAVQASQFKVLQATPRHLDVAGVVQAYRPNISFGTLQNVTLEVDTSNTLTNSFFTTAVPSSAQRQSSASKLFNYVGPSVASSEASAFAYANIHYDFVAANGYVWEGPKPLTVNVHASINNTINNALYTPFNGSSGPHIYVGEGDGVVLKNLAFDEDVVSHELGHHVIFKSIQDISGESLVLHEGLADFMTFARTGDACLGESICPQSTTMSSCVITNKRCLRTADNSLKYRDATYESYSSRPHQQGMLISGFLWDLRKNSVIPSATLTKYVMDAIMLLPVDADIKNFMAALYYVDTKNASTYSAGLDQAAQARGLDAKTLEIDLAQLEGEINNSAVDGDENNEKKKDKMKTIFGCGTLGSSEQDTNSQPLWVLLALLALPIFFVGAQRNLSALQTVKAKKSKN
jgi:hypothetical protein